MLNVQHIQAVRGPATRAHGREAQHGNHIAARPVEFPDLLRGVDAAVQAGGVVLREADHSLQEDEDVEEETQDGVRGLKVRVPGALLVDLDDDEAA